MFQHIQQRSFFYTKDYFFKRYASFTLQPFVFFTIPVENSHNRYAIKMYALCQYIYRGSEMNIERPTSNFEWESRTSFMGITDRQKKGGDYKPPSSFRRTAGIGSVKCVALTPLLLKMIALKAENLKVLADLTYL